MLGLALLAVLAPGGELPPRPGVWVHVDECVGVDHDATLDEIEHQLGIGVRIQGAPDEYQMELQLTCVGEELELWLDDPLTGRSMTRRFDEGEDEGKKRNRRIASAIADTVRTTWAELELTRRSPARAQEPPGPVRRRARRVARQPVAPWEFDDGFVATVFPSGPVLYGEQTRLLHRPFRHLAWSAGGYIAGGRDKVENGRIGMFTVTVAGSVLGWGSVGPVDLYAGGGVRGGWLRMRGEPDDPDDFHAGDDHAFWAGPFAQGRIAVGFHRYVGLALDAEFGWNVLPVREQGLGTFETELVGPWIGMALELVTRF